MSATNLPLEAADQATADALLGPPFMGEWIIGLTKEMLEG
jgi:hypothetical protein